MAHSMGCSGIDNNVCGLTPVVITATSSAVMDDLYARKVVGWSMKSPLSRELALVAFVMAVWRRKTCRAGHRSLGLR